MLLQNPDGPARRGIAGPGTLLLILVTLLLLASERMTSLETSYYDFLQRQQPATASDRILLVDTGAGRANRNLWDSDEISPLIEALNAAGAAVIVPVEAPPAKTNLPDIEQLTALAQLEQRTRRDAGSAGASNTYLADQLTRLQELYARQTRIATTVKDAGNVVLPVLARPTRQALEDTRNDCRRHALATPDNGSEPWVRDADGTLTLSNVLCEGATHAGFMQYWADADGIVRRTTLLAKSESRIFPSLSLAAAQAGEHAGPVRIDGANRLTLNDAAITTGPGFTSLIRYYDSPAGNNAFTTISSAELLGGKMPGELIRDRIVLVGNLADGASVDYRTPFSENVPMAIMLATTVSNLLQSDFIARPTWLGSAELALLLLIGVIVLLVAPTLSANRAVLSILLLVGVL
ncbi:MAG: CHASE2 domain-containing protein, partial [Gammaproteobacteria bacterium]